ncbi:uncharacterized protein MKK02DRAFT_42878 [Dioszegia hungarica]|uniref:Uncharacterized protein n=1 Tax=Dioszegia hungarica TaxID=4972 RepID=A0AA38HGJ1_9TREE|nr:uncharacterized protein MKK02DRAFT_42878 [Dioszegia hungarica]KAI9638484.1 hypothetical protein MKK02DRAFT_42878 [Dioszegia hungarica]
MSSPGPFFRNFSNKENSTFTTSPLFTSTPSAGPSTHKPRVGGVGKAPKRSRDGHSTKPYQRNASTARAKARATSPVKGGTEGKGAPKQKGRPAPIITSVPMMRVIQPPRPVIRVANIPVRLPRPRVPPVMSLPGEMSHIPIEWALPRLRSHFPALLAVSSQYRPQPEHTRPSASPSASQRTFAFAIPQLTADSEGNAELEAKIKGRQPDVCLAIKGKGHEGGAARLLPVNSLVYASQCSYWPRETETSAANSTAESDPSSSTLPVIAEESSDEQASSSDSDATITPANRSSPPSPTDSPSSSSSSDSESDTPASTSHILHLPLLALTIPHPASFPTLHTHLHLPTRPLIPSLLALPPTCLTLADAAAELDKQGMDVLMHRLEYMHGFWSNLCALGISGESSWKGLGEAWGLVIAAVAKRSRPVGGEVQGQEQDEEMSSIKEEPMYIAPAKGHRKV